MNQIKFLTLCCFSLGLLLVSQYSHAQKNVLTTDAIKAIEVSNFEKIYEDRGTGGDMDLSVWKAKLPLGFYALGYLAVVL